MKLKYSIASRNCLDNKLAYKKKKKLYESVLKVGKDFMGEQLFFFRSIIIKIS